MKSENELIDLKDWCHCVVDHILGGEADDFSSQMLSSFKNVIENSYKNKDLKGLRMVRRDLEGGAMDMNQEDRLALDKKLRALGGDGLSSFDKLVSKVIKNGKIKNEDEYFVVMDTIDRLSQSEQKSEGDKQRIDELNILVIEFEKRQVEKAR